MTLPTILDLTLPTIHCDAMRGLTSGDEARGLVGLPVGSTRDDCGEIGLARRAGRMK